MAQSQYNGGCPNGQWVNGQCVSTNNGRWNDQGRGRDEYGRGELNATVSSFSPYNLYLNDGMHVELHHGTVINPTGITLRPGMRVRVVGFRNGDGSFNANEIDVIGGYAATAAGTAYSA